ncbi:MAG: YihY/virulence factor BrkB family protein [Bacteroidetes bacterium]|nr:YihY/virulence factor BrkB family protein [Bacteroidota bacterium]
MFHRILTRSRLYLRLCRSLDRLKLPGFRGASLYAVLKTMFRELGTHKLNIRGAAVTFNFFMAIPPSLLFFCSLVPYLRLSGVEASLLSIIRIISPNDVSYASLSGIVIDFLHNERRDILSFGVLSTFFFSSNGIMGLIRSFDRSLPVYIRRSAAHRRWTAIRLTFAVLVVTIFTIAALILQTQYINDLIDRYTGHAVLLQAMTLFIIVLMIFLVICLLYTYGPSLKERFPFFSPGAIFATVSCVLLSAAFFYLAKNVIHYNKVYGSIGSLMAFMVWLFLNTQLVLIGFEINLSILVLGTEAKQSLAITKASIEKPSETD